MEFYSADIEMLMFGETACIFRITNIHRLGNESCTGVRIMVASKCYCLMVLKSPFIIFDENVNSAVYAELLINSGPVGLTKVMFGECYWYLVQDGASCHISVQSLDGLFEIYHVFRERPRIPLILAPLNVYGERSNDDCNGIEFKHARIQSKQFRQ
jgi:hypothetical protein